MSLRRRSFAIYYLTIALTVLDIAIVAIALTLAKGPVATLLWSALVAATLTGVLLVRTRFVIARQIRLGDIAEREMIRLMTGDALTGALLRGSFLTKLKEAIVRNDQSPVALLLVDVDHFKAVNDSFGHAVGDQVLQYLVEVARSTFPTARIGRLGGDEFAILVEGPVDQIIAVAERFILALRVPRTISGRHISVSASVGLAATPQHSSFPDELILYADLALYESKRRGRGCVTAFEDALMTDQKHRRFVERELRAAILLNDLELHYQPIIDLNGTTIGVEALVRWHHPLRGLIMPGDFISIAEQSNLIDMLGEWVLRRACRDGARLPGSFIGINVSGDQLKRDEIVDMVRRVLFETGLPASRFTFEITETVALVATPSVLKRLQQLRDLGASISLDDFGTGNTGFNALHSLPVDSIKIDRSYVQAMEHDPVASILVSALGAIGRARGLAVVAEGIETQTHLTMAKAGGCSMFQGYLIGRPAPLASPKPLLSEAAA